MRGRFDRSRSANFSPNQLLNKIGWYDPSDRLSITSSAGEVSALSDKFGVGNHLLQTTKDNKPLTTESSINGLQTVKFDGSDDFLVCTLVSTITQPITVFSVNHLTANPSTTRCLIGLQPGDGNLAASVASGNKWGAYMGSLIRGAAITNINIPIVIATIYNGANSAIYINGDIYVSGNVGSATNFTTLYLGINTSGGASPFGGHNGETVVVGHAADHSEVRRVTGYLCAKWRI